jgi:hypothetical protein
VLVLALSFLAGSSWHDPHPAVSLCFACAF